MSAFDSPTELSAAGQLLTALLKAHSTVEAALELQLRQHLGIGGSSFDILRTLIDAPDGQLKMVDIADQMLISRSGVTQSVDRLEKLGLVSRVTTRDDRRLVLAVITPAGRAAVPQGRDIIEAVAARYLTQPLTEPQLTTLGKALAKMIEVGRPSAEPPSGP